MIKSIIKKTTVGLLTFILLAAVLLTGCGKTKTESSNEEISITFIQDTLGHQDISTTMNIYTDATKEMKKQEFESLDNYLKKAV